MAYITKAYEKEEGLYLVQVCKFVPNSDMPTVVAEVEVRRKGSELVFSPPIEPEEYNGSLNLLHKVVRAVEKIEKKEKKKQTPIS
jgi:hypothetical protein